MEVQTDNMEVKNNTSTWDGKINHIILIKKYIIYLIREILFLHINKIDISGFYLIIVW